MGCVVNGPGEAKEADLGVAGGIGEGLIIKQRYESDREIHAQATSFSAWALDW